MPELTRANAQALITAYERREVVREAIEPPGLSAAERFSLDAAVHGLDEPGFDWTAWDAVTSERIADPAFIAGADPVTLRRIMTAHVRINRFNEGHLERMDDAGVIELIVGRLRALAAGDQLA